MNETEPKYPERIRAQYEHLSAGYRRVADYVLQNYRDVAFMTASQIGRATGVDTTVVVRLAQRLGYPGFPEMLAEIKEDIKRDLSAVYEPMSTERTPYQVFRRGLIEDRHSLNFVLSHTDAETIETIVGKLVAATAVTVLGEGSAAHAAALFALRLQTMGCNITVAPADATGRAALLAGLQPGHVFLAVSLTDLNAGAAAMLKVARQHGASTIAVAPSQSNAAAAAAEHVLVAPARGFGLIPSVTTVDAMLNALSSAVGLSLDQQMDDSWTRRFERAYNDLNASQRAAALSPRTTAMEIRALLTQPELEVVDVQKPNS